MNSPRSRARARDERGAIAVIVAVLAVAMFVVAALVVDLGFARDTKRQSQNAADASALAAGNALYETDLTCPVAPCFGKAVSAAKSYASVNFGVPASAWASCTDAGKLAYVPLTEPGSCISFDQLLKPTQVRVVIPKRTVGTGLGALTGVQKIDVSTVARSTINPEPVLPCGLCVLGSGTTHNLQNGDAYVDNGNAHFNGNVNVSSNGLVVADGSITVEGTASGPNSNYTPDPTEGAAPIEDPLGWISLPPEGHLTLLPKTNPCSNGPGIYTSYDLRGITCTLQAGLYVIRAGTWDLAGNSNTVLKGDDVTLYFTCSTLLVVRPCNPGEAGATMDFSGNGSIQIKAPTTGARRGLGIVYDRNNTSTLRFTGNGAAGMSGTIYAPSAKLLINGNGCANPYRSVVVVKELEFNGNPACLRVDYDESRNPTAEPGELRLDQ